jgi:hypothetical protein
MVGAKRIKFKLFQPGPANRTQNPLYPFKSNYFYRAIIHNSSFKYKKSNVYAIGNA